MSKNSSDSPNGIQSWDDYNELSELYHDAADRINSGGTGSGWSGIHYLLMHRLRQYGRVANGREAAVQELKKLLKEFESKHGVEQERNSSDEDFLSRYEDEL